MIVLAITTILGEDGTVILAFLLYLVLVLLLWVIKKKFQEFFPISFASGGRIKIAKRGLGYFFKNNLYYIILHLFLFLSLLLGIINLYTQDTLFLFLTFFFLVCSLVSFLIYLCQLLIVIYKTWWN